MQAGTTTHERCQEQGTEGHGADGSEPQNSMVCASGSVQVTVPYILMNLYCLKLFLIANASQLCEGEGEFLLLRSDEEMSSVSSVTLWVTR